MNPDLNSSSGFRVGDHWISPNTNEIGGARVDAKAMGVLVALARGAPAIVSTAALLDEIWSEVVVGDNVVHQAIAHLRKALGDDARSPRFIENIPRRGYRLIAPTRSGHASPSGDESVGSPRQGLDRIHVGVTPIAGDVSVASRDAAASIARYLSWQGGVFRAHQTDGVSRTDVDYRVLIAVELAGRAIEVAWRVLVDETSELVWANRLRESGEAFTTKNERIAEMIAEGALSRITDHVIGSVAGQELSSLSYSRLILKAEQLSYLERQRMLEREAAIKRAIELEPRSGFGHACLASFLSWQVINGAGGDSSGHSASLRDAARKALFNDGNDPAVLLSVGTTYCRVGEYDRGLPLLRRAFRMAPTVAAKDQLARSLCFAGQPDEAITLFEEILDTMPEGQVFPYVRLAIALAQAGRLEEALTRARESVLHYPEDYYSWLALANLLAQLRGPGSARHALDEARRLVPNLNLKRVIERTEATYGRTGAQRLWLTGGLVHLARGS